MHRDSYLFVYFQKALSSALYSPSDQLSPTRSSTTTAPVLPSLASNTSLDSTKPFRTRLSSDPSSTTGILTWRRLAVHPAPAVCHQPPVEGYPLRQAHRSRHLSPGRVHLSPGCGRIEPRCDSSSNDIHWITCLLQCSTEIKIIYARFVSLHISNLLTLVIPVSVAPTPHPFNPSTNSRSDGSRFSRHGPIACLARGGSLGNKAPARVPGDHMPTRRSAARSRCLLDPPVIGQSSAHHICTQPRSRPGSRPRSKHVSGQPTGVATTERKA